MVRIFRDIASIAESLKRIAEALDRDNGRSDGVDVAKTSAVEKFEIFEYDDTKVWQQEQREAAQQRLTDDLFDDESLPTDSRAVT